MFSDIPKKTPGVYHIYGGDELLYVGCTVNFADRLAEHLVLNTNTKSFINSATKIYLYPIFDRYERELREYSDITKLKPTHNRRIPSLKVIERNRLREGVNA